MDPQPLPVVSKWLWTTFIIVFLIGALFATWYYMMGPGKTAETTTATTTTLVVADETAGWKSFDGGTYTIEYPTDWLVDAQSTKNNSLYLLTKDRKQNLDAGKIVRVFDISVKVYQSASELPNNQTKKLSFENWIKQEADGFGFIQRKSIVVDGVSGYQGVGSGDSESYLIFVQKGNLIYQIETGDTTIPTATEETILSTLQFTK